jgi:DNA-binding NarL/FixJ family response regulator
LPVVKLRVYNQRCRVAKRRATTRKTVNNQLDSVMRKLGLRSRSDLLAQAMVAHELREKPPHG